MIVSFQQKGFSGTVCVSTWRAFSAIQLAEAFNYIEYRPFHTIWNRHHLGFHWLNICRTSRVHCLPMRVRKIQTCDACNVHSEESPLLKIKQIPNNSGTTRCYLLSIHFSVITKSAGYLSKFMTLNKEAEHQTIHPAFFYCKSFRWSYKELPFHPLLRKVINSCWTPMSLAHPQLLLSVFQ